MATAIPDELWIWIDDVIRCLLIKYHQSGNEDLAQDLRLRVWKAWLRWDPERSQDIQAFFRCELYAGMKDHWRKHYNGKSQWQRQLDSLERKIHKEREGSRRYLILKDIIPDRRDTFSPILESDMLKDIRPMFTDTEWKLLMLRVNGILPNPGRQHGSQEAARLLGVHLKQIDNTSQRIKKKGEKVLRAIRQE